jgi:hypothetical protein
MTPYNPIEDAEVFKLQRLLSALAPHEPDYPDHYQQNGQRNDPDCP